MYLQTAGKSSHTTRAYLQDLRAFAIWFRTSNGEDFSPSAVDPRDITEYRGYLLRTGVSPATVNRRLSSLRRFFKWAHRRRLVEESPFDMFERVYVREQSQQEIAPRWLASNEQLALLRAVRKGNRASKEGEDAGGGVGISSAIRDLAVIETLVGTGSRIYELANLSLEDVEVSERKGLIRVREGKGGKSSSIPLDNRSRWKIARRQLKVCVFVYLAYELKTGDLSVAGSELYADFRTQLLPWEECVPLSTLTAGNWDFLSRQKSLWRRLKSGSQARLRKWTAPSLKTSS